MGKSNFTIIHPCLGHWLLVTSSQPLQALSVLSGVRRPRRPLKSSANEGGHDVGWCSVLHTVGRGIFFRIVQVNML